VLCAGTIGTGEGCTVQTKGASNRSERAASAVEAKERKI
jgi:hypothetical protein